jgi:glycosyltransferase involved in cell wall biosynthesis
MIQKVSRTDGLHLEAYAGLAYLSSAVQDLRMAARLLAPKLKGRTVWMVNSTAQGGGVAEMMPRLVGMLRDVGVKTEWRVIGSKNSAFFELTKRIHNLIHVASLKQNHLMVNVIQRCSTVVVQNSLQEGFGLTAAEALWKRIPVLGSSACGLRLQIRDRIDGRLTSHPQDPHEIAEALDEMLSSPVQRELFGRSAQRRVYDRFLVFTQVESWLRRLAEAASTPRSSVSAK